MNTPKHSPEKDARTDAAVPGSTAFENSDAPEPDLDTPLFSEEAVRADRARREAAAAAFRNEKAHERPPRHQA